MIARKAVFACALALAAFAAPAARAAGTTPLALVQQFDTTGSPLDGCLIYFYVSGTVATPQQVYADFGLSQPLPNPLQCDGFRVPQHWLADGLIHVRLTSAAGVVQIDSTLQVLGPSSGGGGGGGGGGTADPTAVASTGDIKYRASGEILLGWVILNGQSIGNATSGATQRANADTQNLFVYLWSQCNDNHCPVSSGRGSTALGDYNNNKQIALPDLRSRALVGRDCMGTNCAGRLAAQNITSGGGDDVDTVLATGGRALQNASTSIGQANLPAVNFTGTASVSVNVSGANHSHPGGAVGIGAFGNAGSNANLQFPSFGNTGNSGTLSMSGSGSGSASVSSGGSGVAALSGLFSNMGPFAIGTWYMKL